MNIETVMSKIVLFLMMFTISVIWAACYDERESDEQSFINM